MRDLTRAVDSSCPWWLRSERDDLVQAALLRVVRRERAGSFRANGAYLRRTARCVVLDEIRRRRRKPEVALDESCERASEGTPLAELACERHELIASVRRAMSHLRPSRRCAVRMYLEGRGLDESARLLQWARKRVDNELYRGLADLRRVLGTGNTSR